MSSFSATDESALNAPPTAKKLIKQAAIAQSERLDTAKAAHQKLAADLAILPAALEKPLVDKISEVHGNSALIQTQFKKLEGEVATLHKQTKKWKSLVGSTSALSTTSLSSGQQQQTSVSDTDIYSLPKSKMGREVDELQEKAEIVDRELRVLEDMMKIIRNNEY